MRSDRMWTLYLVVVVCLVFWWMYHDRLFKVVLTVCFQLFSLVLKCIPTQKLILSGLFDLSYFFKLFMAWLSALQVELMIIFFLLWLKRDIICWLFIFVITGRLLVLLFVNLKVQETTASRCEVRIRYFAILPPNRRYRWHVSLVSDLSSLFFKCFLIYHF